MDFFFFFPGNGVYSTYLFEYVYRKGILFKMKCEFIKFLNLQGSILVFKSVTRFPERGKLFLLRTLWKSGCCHVETLSIFFQTMAAEHFKRKPNQIPSLQLRTAHNRDHGPFPCQPLGPCYTLGGNRSCSTKHCSATIWGRAACSEVRGQRLNSALSSFSLFFFPPLFDFLFLNSTHSCGKAAPVSPFRWSGIFFSSPE